MSLETSTPNILNLIMYNAATSQLGWYFRYSCTTSCSPATSNIFVSQENEVIVIGMYHNDFPKIFEVSLTDGSLKNAGVESSQSFNSISKPIMTQFGSSDTQVIISYPYITNSNFIIWSTNTSSVIASYDATASGSSITAVAGSQNNGMLYIASIGGVNSITMTQM